MEWLSKHQIFLILVIVTSIVFVGELSQSFADLPGAKEMSDKALEEMFNAKDEEKNAEEEFSNAKNAAYKDKASDAAKKADHAATRAQGFAKKSQDAANDAQANADSTDKSELNIAQSYANTAKYSAEYAKKLAENADTFALKAQDIAENKSKNPKGGCLIATAAYGTELAPQVQLLREIRDNTIMSTVSGASFMTGFNTLYYSFSPTIADWERENSLFREAVKIFITPMISTLSIMTLVDDGNEMKMMGIGISVIVLNFGMYVVVPMFVGFRFSKYLKSFYE